VAISPPQFQSDRYKRPATATAMFADLLRNAVLDRRSPPTFRNYAY
jgi:hypothetical protein